MPAKSTDIDLLPKDLAVKRRFEPEARVARGPLVEYTDASSGKKADAPAPKKPSLLLRLFGVFRRTKAKPEQKLAFKSTQAAPPKKEQANYPVPALAARDLPQGKPLPSALFAKAVLPRPALAPAPVSAPAPKPTAQPVHEPFEPGLAAQDVMAMHSPSVLIGQVAPAPKAVVPKKEEPQKEPQKLSWLRRWFLRKKEPAAAVRELPATKDAPSFVSEKALRPEQSITVPLRRAPLPPEPRAAKAVLSAAAVPAIPAAKARERGTAGETEAPVHRLSSFDVNLLSAEYTETFKKSNPLAFLGAGVGLSALLVASAYGVLFLYESRAAAALASEERVISALRDTIATYEDISGEDVVLRTKAEAAAELIGNHVSWHSFLGELEAATIPEITYLTLTASTEGTMLVSAFADSYTSLARQIVVFQETEWIRDITITSATRVEESATTPAGVSFDMSLEVDTSVLYQEDGV
ncbi:MAG: hypothetical protein AAB671_00170 [Patescibacteria group bacterium]